MFACQQGSTQQCKHKWPDTPNYFASSPRPWPGAAVLWGLCCALLRCAMLCHPTLVQLLYCLNALSSSCMPPAACLGNPSSLCRLSSSYVMHLTKKWTLASKSRPYSKPTLLVKLCKPGDLNFFMLLRAACAFETIMRSQWSVQLVAEDWL